MDFPKQLRNSIDHFSKLPGIGEKTATRLVLSLATRAHQDLHAFGEAISELVDLSTCTRCGVYSEQSVCQICSNEQRSGSLCVIETYTDYLAIESSGQYDGMYHCLGGVLNPLLGIGPDELKLDKLRDRVIKENVENIILALNPSVEGDATCSYIKQILPSGVNIDRIGFGIPIGGSLEYLDSMTISKALENRKRM